jgi:hypothetical protein
MFGNSGVTERVAASQEGLSFMELVNSYTIIADMQKKRC